MWEVIAPAIPETLYMTAVSSIVSILIGIPLGIILTLTRRGGLSQNKVIYSILDWIVNIIRSLPFIILMFMITPLTRAMIGKTVGSTAALIPLTIAAAPFVARLMESYLVEVDKGVIEAARAMGSTKFQIVTRVMIPEAVPSIINGITLTVVNIVSYSAFAGAIGGGGLGDIANRYGYQRRMYSYLYISCLVIILIVQIIQMVGNSIAKNKNKK